MKRLLSLLLLTALLVSPALADGESPRVSARSYLTEVYGYTPQEADSFEFQDDGKGMLRYWPKDHPEWVYTHPYATSGGEAAPGNAESPFYNGRFYGFPGESAIRDMLRVADQKGWFRQWDRQAIQDFNQALQDSGAFCITANLAAGLASGTLSGPGSGGVLPFLPGGTPSVDARRPPVAGRGAEGSGPGPGSALHAA